MASARDSTAMESHHSLRFLDRSRNSLDWKTGLPREIQSLLSEEGGLAGQESGSAAGIPAYVPREQERTHQYITVKHGLDVLHDAGLNKGTAFTLEERERMGLRGLLPPKASNMELQVERLTDDYFTGTDYIDPSEMKEGGVTHEHTRQWRILQDLQDRNEAQMVCNWPADEVHAIVVTDGSRILGLGDLGINGLGISIGKLDLYVAAAGFSPSAVLPIVIDVGTDNLALRDDKLYLGLHQARVKGAGYYELLDEAVLQFEDFNLEHAQPLLERYRFHHLVFNDDIQGTAATALAGLYGALAVQGKPVEAIKDQRVVVVGAGSAGMGVVSMIAAGMVKHGLSAEATARTFWILDAGGLITAARRDIPAHVQPYARPADEAQPAEGAGLLAVVSEVKPAVLIGLAGAGRLFKPEVLKVMGDCNKAPIIFPMSNPTSKMECTAEDAQQQTGRRAVFASGSPQEDVMFEGRSRASSQANNMYIFPGLAFGAFLGETQHVTDAMLVAASETLPALIRPTDLSAGRVFPRLADIRRISTRVAAETIKKAIEEGHCGSERAVQAAKEGDACLQRWIHSHMWKPNYRGLVRAAER